MAITTPRSSTHRSRITSQGQITVPKAVRVALDVAPGDVLEFEVADGTAIMRPRRRTSILDFAGIAGGRGRSLPSSAEELDDLLQTAATERARRRSKR